MDQLKPHTVALPLQPRLLNAHKANPGYWQEDTVAKEDRGFASMDRNKQREIASKGGRAAHQKGTAHEWTSDEAREAGRKGGVASHQRKLRDRSAGAEQSDESFSTNDRISVNPGDFARF